MTALPLPTEKCVSLKLMALPLHLMIGPKASCVVRLIPTLMTTVRHKNAKRVVKRKTSELLEVRGHCMNCSVFLVGEMSGCKACFILAEATHHHD